MRADAKAGITSPHAPSGTGGKIVEGLESFTSGAA